MTSVMGPEKTRNGKLESIKQWVIFSQGKLECLPRARTFLASLILMSMTGVYPSGAPIDEKVHNRTHKYETKRKIIATDIHSSLHYKWLMTKVFVLKLRTGVNVIKHFLSQMRWQICWRVCPCLVLSSKSVRPRAYIVRGTVFTTLHFLRNFWIGPIS